MRLAGVSTAPIPPPAPGTADRLYTPRFFAVFAAVTLFMTGAALQYHFGQYIEFLGHSVDVLGIVLGAGMFGTLLIRLQVGRWIDRFGWRTVWLCSAVVVTVSAAAMPLASNLWTVGALRATWTMSIAAILTAVAVFAAEIAPPLRRAESLGSMGLAGFTGMIAGPALGDFIFRGDVTQIGPYRLFFAASAACSLLGGLLIAAIPRSPVLGGIAPATISLPRTSSIRLVRQHWPGVLVPVAVVFSMSLCMQMSFLERLAEARGFQHIKLFFLFYGPTAILLRIVGRQVPRRLGRVRTLVGGLLLLMCGLMCIVGIRSQVGLIAPGILMGAGHCFIYPSLVDLGAERFPPACRGTGISLILGAGDAGTLLGFGWVGWMISRFGFDAAVWFLCIAVGTSAAVLALARREEVFHSVAGVKCG